MAHVYFHIDLNAFFASAEVILDPSLKGKPVAVSGQTRRSVVSTASYEARKFGVHSAMPIQEAMKICKDLVVIPGHYAYYESLSEQFIGIIKQYTDLVEQASIDECYADVTEMIRRYSRPLDLAVAIQSQILRETGLSCSIGVAPNLFLAKMASDMKKPMGITVLRIRDVEQKMWPLSISEMRGVGRKTLPMMEEFGIRTIGDLARYKNVNELRPVFGKNTEEMISRANGHDDRQLITESDTKSMGISETMLEDVVDYDQIKGLFRSLSRKLSGRLKESKKAGFHVSIRICYYDFRNSDRSRKLEKPIWKADDLFVEAIRLFDENWEEGDAVRLLGLSVSDFQDDNGYSSQLNLFETDSEDERHSTDIVLTSLNNELGMKAFMRASDLSGNKKDGTR